MFDPPTRAPALDDFQAVVKQRGGRWYHACLRITRDAGLAEDAVQDALLKAWDRRGSFRQDAELDTWIHRIALNAALDLIRKLKPESVDPEQLDEHAGGSATPELQYERQSFGNDLTGAMERLTQLERECFALKHIEGWPLADIAARQNCTVNNAKQTLFRAVRKLRADLNEWRGES